MNVQIPDPMDAARAYFDNEWEVDADGFYHRQAARVVVVNEHNQALLLRGHDFSDTEHWWWFTVGGGLAPGEDPRAGAVREFFEETGYRLDPATLMGPVMLRHATFDFHAVTCRQDELFYFNRLPGSPSFVREGFTDVEREVLDELEAEIASGTVVYPLDFVALTRGWLKGWDGKCPEITEGTVGKR